MSEATFTDLITRVRAGELDVVAADRGHANEIIGAREEARKCRRKRNVAARGEADGHADHVLLGDVAFDAMFGCAVLCLFGVRRVSDVTIEYEYPLIYFRERRQGVAEPAAS